MIDNRLIVSMHKRNAVHVLLKTGKHVSGPVVWLVCAMAKSDI